MPRYLLTFCTMAEADTPEAAEALIRRAVGEGHVTVRIQPTAYPDDPSLKEYHVYEEQTYVVMAEDAQDAIDQVIEDNNDPRFRFNVTERRVVDGPEGWQDEEYESP